MLPSLLSPRLGPPPVTCQERRGLGTSPIRVRRMDTAADEVAALLEGLARGDEGALAARFDIYREDLRREVARGLADDPRLAARFDASDVVQEVFLDARRQVAGFLACGGRIDFWNWLRGLARERR